MPALVGRASLTLYREGDGRALAGQDHMDTRTPVGMGPLLTWDMAIHTMAEAMPHSTGIRTGIHELHSGQDEPE